MARPSVLVLLVASLIGGSAAAQRADLAKARTLYNERQFDAAIEAALVAQQAPELADPATVVLARAYLERYRQNANPEDLSDARVALGTIRVSNLDMRDQIDFLMALGEALFFEDDYGIAQAITAATGVNLDREYASFVHSTDELPYSEVLRVAGLELNGDRVREISNPSLKQQRILESWLSGK